MIDMDSTILDEYVKLAGLPQTLNDLAIEIRGIAVDETDARKAKAIDRCATIIERAVRDIHAVTAKHDINWHGYAE